MQPFRNDYKKLIYIMSLLFCISCSSYEPFVTAPDFDASAYVNPEDHGGKLDFSLNSSAINSTNNSFTPVTIRGGFKNAYRSQPTPPRPGYGSTSGGGATIEVYVDSTGTLTEIKRIKATSQSMKRFLEKIATESTFIPAMLNGKPVNSYRRMALYLNAQVRTVRRGVNRN